MSHRRLPAALPRLCAVCLLACAALAAAAGEGGFTVTELRARLSADRYLVDAVFDYRFSDTAEEALFNGVPLTLQIHLQLRRQGAWIWESDVVDARLRYRVRYQALSELYEITDLQSGGSQTFVTREGALDALGRLSGIHLVRADALEPGAAYRLSLRTALDIEALPLPLRPTAYLTPAWNLESEWKEWLLRP
ncbi:MAG: DUF4390 domain-containing protein [gamma proteobacterium symbiont of Phacoides pectinatus]